MSHFNPKVAGITAISAIIAAGALYGMTNVSMTKMKKLNSAKASEAVQILLPAQQYESIDITGLDSEYKAVKDAFKAMDADGNVLGYITLLAVPGYNGNIEVNVATDATGQTIENLRIGAHAETENLGAKATEESFYNQFSGVSAPTDFNTIQAITGATITSTAVMNAANLAAQLTQDVLSK